MGSGTDAAGFSNRVIKPVGVFVHAIDVGKVGKEILATETETGRDKMRGVVVGRIGHLVGGGFEAIAGTQGETLGDVHLRTDTHAMCGAEFCADGFVLMTVIVVVAVQCGHTIVLELILSRDERTLLDQEGGAHIRFQRRGQRETVGIFVAAIVGRIIRVSGVNLSIEVVSDFPIVSRGVERCTNTHEISRLVYET